ncbi:hypothetical protein BpHYR1_012291 [Brachionus plicatilis]|uniref:Uncharacterized protein n=1 Tax=Brachionus plicatilis TaxID=10195 RepID=A0A3M7PVZ0_BRAPC|nr:hypothetical protein BpHYR1_012291 [Brachionus plicatilis]
MQAFQVIFAVPNGIINNLSLSTISYKLSYRCSSNSSLSDLRKHKRFVAFIIPLKALIHKRFMLIKNVISRLKMEEMHIINF